MYIVLAIVIFGILIATHELGHFLAAKFCGVRVLEFSLGMGPAILKRQRGETLYSWRLLPFGGFCAMEGEDSASEDERAFSNQSGWKKFIILVAGAAVNFLVGFLIVLVLFAVSESTFSKPVITGFMDGCPYVGEQGFQEGDTLYRINGERIYVSDDAALYLARGGDTADIVLIRNGEKVYLDEYPITRLAYDDGSGGTVLRYGMYIGEKESGAFATLKYSWYCSLDFVRMVRLGLADLIRGAVGIQDLYGPVGIVDIMNDVGQSADTVGDALSEIFYLFAFVAVNLAVMNLLPIPALDGGRIFFLLLTWMIEKLSRRKLDPKYEGYINAAGLVLLLGLMVFVMFNDILKLFR